jgi:hypothetical protein
MKRMVPLVLVVGGVALVLWAVVRSSGSRQPVPPQAAAPAPTSPAQPAVSPPSVPPPAAVTTPPVEGEQIVYQFDDEAKMREFANVWQSRQKTLLRMAVLRAYWDNEQAGSTALNTQLETQYHLSPTGNYVLDAEKRVLMERPAPPADAAPAEGQPAPAAPAEAETGTIVHTFATDEELQAFGNLWQQRQGSGVRLAVLKSFWDEENAELSKLNTTLSETYQLDVTKNYTLDAQRRVIIERPEAAVPPDANIPPAQPAPAPAGAAPTSP